MDLGRQERRQVMARFKVLWSDTLLRKKEPHVFETDFLIEAINAIGEKSNHVLIDTVSDTWLSISAGYGGEIEAVLCEDRKYWEK